MTAVGETDLATKCLDFCQTLSSQGSAFKFSLTMGSNFSFSLDTRGVALDIQAKIPLKKKPSPSTLRRNARRREAFLNKKRNPAPSSPARPLQHPPKVQTPEKERLTDAIGDLHLTPVLGQGRVDVATHPSPPPSPSEPEGASSPSGQKHGEDLLSSPPPPRSLVCDLHMLPFCRGPKCGKTFRSEDELRNHTHKVHPDYTEWLIYSNNFLQDRALDKLLVSFSSILLDFFVQ